MTDRVWMLPAEIFVAAWNGARSLLEVDRRMKTVVGVPVPRSSIISRVELLRRSHVDLKIHVDDEIAIDFVASTPQPGS